jgi:hypothetical protein
MSIKNENFKDNTKIHRLKTPIKIKVQATQHGYLYAFRSLTGELIDSRIGLLPENFSFNKQTAELYARCQAKRRLNDADLEGFYVALVCSSLPLAGNADRRIAA